MDVHWAEVCDFLPTIEELSEDTTFAGFELAAALGSKCFYHLQDYADSLRLALSAGQYLNLSAKSEYVETLLAKCIDQYKVLRIQKETDETVVIDPRMEAIIEQMFLRCYADGCFEQAMGVALDTHRLDKVREIGSKAIEQGRPTILNYAFHICQSARNITPREFRLAVIDVLVELYGTLPHPDYANVCFGLQYLDRPADVAKTLEKLCRGTQEEALQAYQICFDLQETENQGFVLKTISALTPEAPPAGAAAPAGAAPEGYAPVSGEDADPSAVPAEEYQSRLGKVKRILLESFDVDLVLNFLFKQCKADMNVLKTIKQLTEAGRSSILHNAIVVAHGYMFSGTTIDTFLRENLDWLGKATNWAKFTAVGSIGVVHKGHIHESMKLLQPYLPQAGQSHSPYSESGALYALGLIHANQGGHGDSATISYLHDALRNAGTNDVVQHGACLGMGLAAMATGKAELFEEFRQILFMDNAVAGEGAALSIGLLMVGQSDSVLAQSEIPNLLNAAHDSPHEKIVRALSLSIAMMVYGKEESADALIEQLSRDRDPIIRYGASYAVAMAYCGTSDNNAIRKLLHVAVSDVNDDVRRSAVTCIGFVSFRNPDIVPKLVVLLAESFNPHVRYGACMAVGIACAGLANKDAIDLLTPMIEDPIDFVRQGALIAMALVLQQASEARSPSVKKFRDNLIAIITDKHQSVMTKTGAILACGIIDAGGRNVVLNLQSRAGFLKMGAAVGMMMFLQYWYWYPLMHMLSLAFAPTMLIGLNKNFDMPTNFGVTCNAPPSMFAYPKVEEKKGDEKKVVTTAVLSTTVKAKAREARKEARKLGRHMSMTSQTDKDGHTPRADKDKDTPRGEKDKEGADEKGHTLERVTSFLSNASYLSTEEIKTVGQDETQKVAKKEKEPSSFTVTNPSRVIPAQVRFLSLPRPGHEDSMQTSATVVAASRYLPVDITRRSAPSGIIMLIDEDPTQPESVEKVERIVIGQGDEAAMPEPFLWDPNDP